MMSCSRALRTAISSLAASSGSASRGQLGEAEHPLLQLLQLRGGVLLLELNLLDVGDGRAVIESSASRSAGRAAPRRQARSDAEHAGRRSIDATRRCMAICRNGNASDGMISPADIVHGRMIVSRSRRPASTSRRRLRSAFPSASPCSA